MPELTICVTTEAGTVLGSMTVEIQAGEDWPDAVRAAADYLSSAEAPDA